MPILKDGVSPVSVRLTDRNLNDKDIVKIVLIDDNGDEHPIWNGLPHSHLVTFKSEDGSQIYKSVLCANGAIISKPIDPTPVDTGEGEEIASFEGWSTSMHATTGEKGDLICGDHDVTYYAAFSAERRQYLIKNGDIIVDTTTAATDGSVTFSKVGNRLKIYGTLARIGIARFAAVNVDDYTSLVLDGTFNGTNPRWGLGTQSTGIASSTSGGVNNYITSYSNSTKTVDISSVTQRGSATCVYLEFDTQSENLISNLYLSRTIS